MKANLTASYWHVLF